jgi:transcriptional regulator with XRE-family HTH domain
VPEQDPDELARNVGVRISEIRGQAALTQQDLATRVQTSVQWISRVETGRENLTLTTLVKLANALEVNVIDFFTTPSKAPRKSGRGRPRKSV